MLSGHEPVTLVDKIVTGTAIGDGKGKAGARRPLLHWDSLLQPRLGARLRVEGVVPRGPGRQRLRREPGYDRLINPHPVTSKYSRKRHWCSDLYNSCMTSSVMFRLVQTCSVTSIQTSPLSEGNSRSRSPSESPSASSASCGSPRRTWSRTPGSPPGTRCCNSQGLVFRIKKKRVLMRN